MPLAIGDLPRVQLDYTGGGPALQAGLSRLEVLLEQDRTGYLKLEVQVDSGTVGVVLARSDLYVMGFESSGGWWRFSDAEWPFTPEATSLGHDGQYKTLGGLQGSIDVGAIAGIGGLLQVGRRSQWKSALRTLLVVVAECARLIPVRMRVLGLLNGIFAQVQLSEIERYIKNWSKASKGHDMSEQKHPNLRVGFSDPTIIRR